MHQYTVGRKPRRQAGRGPSDQSVCRGAGGGGVGEGVWAGRL